jgi:hypothetical protein
VIPVCIFSKPPIAGEVKTRLIPALRSSAAAELAGAMLLDAWSTVMRSPGFRPILATTRPGDFPVRAPAEDIWLQGEGDLGQRIERILTRALLDAKAAVALGADSPALTPTHLAAALASLELHDAAIGPASDGGFYLLAIRKCHPNLFCDLPWSNSKTRQALRARLEQFRWSIAELEPLFDVDTPADLEKLDEFLIANPSLAPASRACRLQNRGSFC